tara:strand:- start:320 stop:1939 length:1620 start_codon:yes stop_codon:yes gene_type:complete
MTVNIAKITSIGASMSRSSTLLRGDIRRSIQVDKIYRSEIVKKKQELIRIRDNTFNSLSAGLSEDQSGGGGGIGGIITWLLGEEAARRIFRKFRPGGRGPGGGGRITFGRGSGGPKGPLGGIGRTFGKSGIGRTLTKAGLKRVPFLDIAFGALAYGDRRNQGQTQGQAIGGAIAQTGGSIGGGLIGQALIPVPVLGYIIGSVVGSTLTTTIFDKVTGVDKVESGAEKRRILEEEKFSAGPSYFSASLDRFDLVLDKFQLVFPFLIQNKGREIFPDNIGSIIPDPKPPSSTNEFSAVQIGLDVLSIATLIFSLANSFVGVVGDEVPASALVATRLAKYRRLLQGIGLLKKPITKTYTRPNTSGVTVDPVQTRVQLENTFNPLRPRKPGENLVGDILKRDQIGRDNPLLNMIKGANRTIQKRYGNNNKTTLEGNISKDVPQLMTGGNVRVDAPEGGGLVQLMVHGKEDIQVVPIENNFTRSRGGKTKPNTIVRNTISKGRSGQAPPIRGGGQAVPPKVILARTDPFVAAAKYSQMIGQLTT